MGVGDSSGGSDSAPSEDNLQAEQLVKNLPIVDKTLKVQLKKEQEKKAKIEKEKKAEPPLRKADSASKFKQAERELPLRRQNSPKKLPQQSVLTPAPIAPRINEESKTADKAKRKVEMKDA